MARQGNPFAGSRLSHIQAWAADGPEKAPDIDLKSLSLPQGRRKSGPQLCILKKTEKETEKLLKERVQSVKIFFKKTEFFISIGISPEVILAGFGNVYLGS